MRTAITNITSKTHETTPDKYIKKTFEELKSEVFKVYTLFIDWEGYFSYFDFHVTYPISNEYVYEIWRDYNILDEESRGLEKYKKAIISK
jgi:hypothetical protein